MEGTTMPNRGVVQKDLCSVCVEAACLPEMNFAVGIPMVRMVLAANVAMDKQGHDHGKSRGDNKTPIKHVIVIIGENRTFDHIFATYQPKHGETISNLLWKGIIKPDGTPGKNFPKAHQNSACDTGAGGVCPNTGKVSTGEPFQINPDDKALYDRLPSPFAGGPHDVCTNNSNCIDTPPCIGAPSHATWSRY